MTTVDDMRAIFGEPVEGRDYHKMPDVTITPRSLAEIQAIEAAENAATETEQKRARLIADARALLDLLEANPALPFAHFEIQEHASGTDEEEREQVNAAAEILGVTPELGHAEHYSATKAIGRASYRLVAIPDRAMARHRAVYALGKAAFEQQEAEATS